MKLGINIGYWGLGLTSEEQLALVQEAERLGYDSVWSAEAYGSDAATILGWLAGQTERIKIGSAIFQMPGRSPAMTAMTAATLDQLSGGRMLLGIGSSGPQVAEGWHGQRFGKQLQRTREYVAVVRMALARERVEFSGETLTLPLPDGPGKALKLTIAPVQERIPIYLAAIGPEQHDAGGRDRRRLAADDVLARARRRVPPAARRGLRAGGGRQGLRRLRHRTEHAGLRHRRPRRRARRDAPRSSRSTSAAWARATRTSTTRSRGRYGFEDAARRVQDLYLEGKREEAAAALPDELIDTVTLCGPRDAVRERLGDPARCQALAR